VPIASRDEATDEALMTRFQGGDASALAALVQRHKTTLYNFILRQVRHPMVAEDLVQDVFLRIVHRAGDYKHEARFATWAYSIARNISIDHLRKMALRRHPSLDQPAGAGSEFGQSLGERTADDRPSASIDRAAIGGELGIRITRAVEDLPPDQREVFLLRQLAEVPFREIADIVGASENTVKSRMRYALERLQAALRDYEDYARALR
jgi:RNA polymerase sigma-70 factor (ECF subfamily)